MIKAASADTFGFDCVCLIKGLLWGWSGDGSKTYGGAKYAVNGVPDIGADTMITKCSGVSTDFSKVEVGEAVWCKGHIGIYIGGGLAVECTPKWKNCVQVTACNCTKSGYNRRNWTKHGKLPYVTYTGESENAAAGGKPADSPAIEMAHRRKGKRTIVFFCHPYSAYERGSNENMNRLIRRFFPKGTNFDEVTKEQVAEAERWVNNYPRKLLGWKSASDLFNEEAQAA